MRIPVKWCFCLHWLWCCLRGMVASQAADAIGQGLPNLIRGNERFGRMLLESVHRRDPEHNVVVSPISLTIIVAAIQNSSRTGSCARRSETPSDGEGSPTLAFRRGCCWRPSKNQSGPGPQELDRFH